MIFTLIIYVEFTTALVRRECAVDGVRRGIKQMINDEIYFHDENKSTTSKIKQYSDGIYQYFLAIDWSDEIENIYIHLIHDTSMYHNMDVSIQSTGSLFLDITWTCQYNQRTRFSRHVVFLAHSQNATILIVLIQ